MTELDDQQLLAEFARAESEAAFATLVAGHVNLVYSAALRFTGNPHHAQEITQAVFIILARKAGSLGDKVVLSGWLYQTARLTAANFMKGERRRQQREQEAYMTSTLNEPSDAAWEQLAPLLDEAMGDLGETDRNAVVLRFFENRTAGEVAAKLNLTEAAAHKRTTRALEKLRKIFSKRGVTLSAALIAGAVSANSVQAAPVGLVAAATSAAAKGTAISATLTTLVNGTMKTMTWLKLKFAIGMGVATIIAGGAATVAVSQSDGADNLSPRDIAKQAQAAYAALSSYSDSGQVISDVSGHTVTTKFSIRLQRPNQYRIAWTQTNNSGGLGSQGSVWSDGAGDYYLMTVGSPKPGKIAEPRKMQDMCTALASATGVSGMAAATIPGTFFKQVSGDVLDLPASGQSDLKHEPDEKIGNVDCFVISSVIDTAKMRDDGRLPGTMGALGTATSKTTLWIGKQDHFIHQTRTSVDGASLAPVQMSDADIKGILEKQNKPATPAAVAAMRAGLEAAMKQAKKSGKVVFTQTHENIVVNQTFSPADFAR